MRHVILQMIRYAMMRKAIILLFALLSAFCMLSSCAKKEAWRADVPMSELTAAVEAGLASEGLTAMDEAYLKGALKLDDSLFDDYAVKINAYGVNIDEYGIFKALDEDSVPSVRAAVEDYLRLRKETWMEEYMPEEKPKLEAAEVRTCGLYVMYAILSDGERETAFSGFEDALRAD